MTTNTKILCAATIAGLVLLCARKAKGAAAVGKVERIKRRIYKEVSLAQSSGVDFTKKYDQLTPDEKQALERIGHEFGWKQSKRAIETGKTYTESYYSSLRRAWNAVSGIEGVGRAYNVKDAKGNVCLTWIEDAAAHYDAEQRTLEAEQRAMEARKRLQSMRRKVSGISGYRRNYFGGNSGYSGYSMSKRAIEARNEGKFPKTDFKRIYHVSDNSLAALLELGYIRNSEWHHTSSWGNRTKFYEWDEPEFAQLYADNKKQIDTWARNGELDGIILLFEGEEALEYYAHKQEEEKRTETLLEEQRTNNQRLNLNWVKTWLPDGIFYYDGGLGLTGYFDFNEFCNGASVMDSVHITSEDRRFDNESNKWYIKEQFDKEYYKRW